MSTDKVLEHLWRYFALHAQQRVSVFNFFVVLSGVIAAGIGGGLQAGRPLILVFVLGLLLSLLSFVFWKLDQRNSDLIKISEKALREGEEACLPAFARIFTREFQAGTSRTSVDDGVAQTKWTFRRSFRLIFIVMGVLGLAASAYSVYRGLDEAPAKVEKPREVEPSRVETAPNGPPPSQSRPSQSVPTRNIESGQATEPAGSTNPSRQPPLDPGTAPKN